nr:demethylmenaquinone methyltransferase-like isoform X1 [Lytechinus pictus]
MSGSSHLGIDDLVCPARGRINDIIASRGEDTERAYDAWAQYFDEDMITLGYGGYDVMGKNVIKFVTNKNAKILDVGCGTGLFGEKLRSLGYMNIFGVDASDSFLEKSREKGVYLELEEHRFGNGLKLPYSDNSFDVIMAVSILGPNTINPTALYELDGLLSPGGYLMIFIRRSRLDMERENFNVKAVLDDLLTSGRWERLPDSSGLYYTQPNGVPVAEGDEAVEGDGVVVTMKKLLKH